MLVLMIFVLWWLSSFLGNGSSVLDTSNVNAPTVNWEFGLVVIHCLLSDHTCCLLVMFRIEYRLVSTFWAHSWISSLHVIFWCMFAITILVIHYKWRWMSFLTNKNWSTNEDKHLIDLVTNVCHLGMRWTMLYRNEFWVEGGNLQMQDIDCWPQWIDVLQSSVTLLEKLWPTQQKSNTKQLRDFVVWVALWGSFCNMNILYEICWTGHV